MVVLKWSDYVEGPRVKLYGPLCGGLYKGYHECIATWSGLETYAKMNLFTCSRKDNYWVSQGTNIIRN